MEWSDWESGDIVTAPEGRTALDQNEILRRIATGFRQVIIDRAEGDRWANARVVKAVNIGFRGFLLEAEQAIVGRSILASVSDDPGVWVRFYMTPDTGVLDLHYEPVSRTATCRSIAVKLASLLEYEFVNKADL